MADGAGGFFLFLFESFAARALLGSLVAALLVAPLLRRDAVRSVAGRRALLVAPFVVAGLLAVASANRGFLPVLQVNDAPPLDPQLIAGADPLLDVLGDVLMIGGTLDLLVACYLLVMGALVARRVVGVIAAARLRVGSQRAPARLRRRARRIALLTGIDPPDVRVRRNCPGGAFAAGLRTPWIALDRDLVDTLDDRELDALLAHEMAHIRRRDPLFCLLTGLSRDVLFFLPGVHLALFWLRREQEEEADDLAAQCTRRPATLASTILKIWDSQTRGLRLANACSAVESAPGRRLRPAWHTTRDPDQPHVLLRVQRLISPSTDGTRTVRRREIGLPLTVLALAVSLGVVVPAGVTQALDNDGVLVGVFSAPVQTEVESPAFATFRALAPASVRAPRAVAPPTGDVDPLCPCVESPAELRAARSAGATSSSQLVWADDGRDAWELQRLHDHARLRATRELLSFGGASQEVRFLAVSRNTAALR